MIMISNFLFNFTNFCVIISFFIKPLTSGILFSTAVNPEVVAKPLILGILPSTSLILELKSVFLTKPLTSGIFLSILLILSSKSDPCLSYLAFETKFAVSIPLTLLTNYCQDHFLLHHSVCLRQQEQVLIYQYLVYLL